MSTANPIKVHGSGMHLILPAFLLLSLLLAACQPARPLTAADQSAIYTAVVQRLYGIENGVTVKNFPVLYIARQLDAQTTLSEPLQQSIQAGLADLPAQVIWVATSKDVPWDPDGWQVKDGGAGVTLSPIQMQKDGTVQVAAGITYANLGGHGGTYVLARQNGAWTITGTVGPQWIS